MRAHHRTLGSNALGGTFLSLYIFMANFIRGYVRGEKGEKSQSAWAGVEPSHRGKSSCDKLQ